MRRDTLIVLVLTSFIISLFFFREYLLVGYTEKDAYYTELTDQIHTLKLENIRLYTQILAAESLTVIATKAASMGFEKEKPLVLWP